MSCQASVLRLLLVLPVPVCSQCVDNNNRNSPGRSSFCSGCQCSCHLTYLEGGCGLLSTASRASPRSRAGNTPGLTWDNGDQGPRAHIRKHIDTLIPTQQHTHTDPPCFTDKHSVLLYSPPEFAVFDFAESCVVLRCVKYHVPGFKNINFRVNTTQMNI